MVSQARRWWRRRPAHRPTLRDAADAGVGLLTTAAALGVAIWAVDGVRAQGPGPVLAAAAGFAVGDVALRPFLRVLALAAGAVGALLCGIAAQVAVVWVALSLAPGVVVDGPQDVVSVLLLSSVVMAAGRWLLGSNDSAYVLGDLLRRARARTRRGDAVTDDPPGLLVVQIDGVSRPVLLQSIAAGLAPTMARWIREGSHRLAPWWAQVPSTTPASQAGMLHGAAACIPAFRWWDKDLGRLVVTNRPADAALVEQRLSRGDGLLSAGGVAVSTMFSGDAATSLLVMSKAGAQRGFGPGVPFLRFFASPFVLTRGVSLSLVEMVKELYQGRRQRVRGVQPRVPRRGAYVVLRGLTNGLLRDLNLSLVAEHVIRGAPVVFVDLVDYDEIAHHAGPTRPEALRAVEGLDGALALLEQVALAARRNYRIVVCSDHGQSLGRTFSQVEGRSLEEVIRSLVDVADAATLNSREGEEWGPINAVLATALPRAAEGRRPLVLGPDRPVRAPAGPDVPDLVTIASGNLAMAWFPRLPGRVSLEELQERWPHLVPALASLPSIGAVVAHSRALGPVAVTADGLHVLADPAGDDPDPLRRLGPRARADLHRLAGLDNVGDVVVVSAVDDDGGVHAFEELVGSHGGLGGPQNEALLLHPADLHLDAGLLEPVDGREQLVGADAVHRQLVAWLRALKLRP